MGCSVNRAKVFIGVGGFLTILGVFLSIAGPFLVPYEVNVQLLDYLVIDSASSESYSLWAGDLDVQNEYQMVFNFYNLTNPDAVRTNATVPRFELIGPYVYRRYRTSINVSFLEGGNKIQYLDFRDYQYDPVSSNNRSELDIIVNLNPVAVSALEQAGTEMFMLTAAVGGLLKNFTDYLTGPFVSLLTTYQRPSYFNDAIQKQIAAISRNFTGNATLYFIESWANATQVPVHGSNWTGLMLSYEGTASGIPLSTAFKLLDPQQPYSLLSTNPTFAWAWERALVDRKYLNAIQAVYNLTAAQISLIRNWTINSFAPVFMNGELVRNYNLDDIHDIGWVQWIFGTPLATRPAVPQSIFDLFPVQEIGYIFPIEAFETPSDNTFPDWKSARNVMDPATGLENITIYQAFLSAIRNHSSDFTRWGLNSTQAQFLSGYFLDMTALVAPALQAEFGPTGGLILTQSVRDWVFNCDPYLINLLVPGAPPCSFLVNHSVYANNTIYSGKDNITQINGYVAWQAQSVVKGIWNGDLPVTGVTNLGQFQPFLQKGQNLSVFDDNFVRTVKLNYVNTSSVRDINTFRYLLDYNYTFHPDPFYFQATPGLANMTSVKLAPVFFSLWDMLYVNESLRNKVVGLNNNSSEWDDSTVIDVEPTTGNTVQARQRLQINVAVPVNCSWCDPGDASQFDNKHVPRGTVFPIAQAGEYVTISADLANTVRDKLGLMSKAQNLGFIIGISVGVGLGVIGFVLITKGCLSHRRDAYQSVNDDE